jgi:hypothetical protein
VGIDSPDEMGHKDTHNSQCTIHNAQFTNISEL